MSVKPMSGVNLLVSLFILGFVKKGKELGGLGKKRSYKIIVSIILLIFIFNYLLFAFIIGISNLDSNFITAKEITAKEITNQCVYSQNTISERNIILRIDDIQAYYNRELQLSMLKELNRRNITASLGVIPLNILEDNITTEYLIDHKCDFEIVLHGYDHSDYEFRDLSYSEANEKIWKGLEELNKIEKNIVTFIPPQNEISKEAENAVYDNGFKIISTDWNSVYGFSVSTYNWDNYRINNVPHIIDKCENNLDNGDTCIIMVHPQDYKNNYKNYVELLDELEKLDATFISFKDLSY